MHPGRRQHREFGFTYLGVLFLMVLMGLGLSGTAELWSLGSQRAHERELLWVGNQYARALQSYYEQSPGVREYPLRLEDLVTDNRFPAPRHHLRQLYADPVTREAWGAILNPEGRIGGVRSLSDEIPLKRDGFALRWEDFKGRAKYSEWRFVVDVRLIEAKAPSGTGGAPQSAASAASPPFIAGPRR